MEWLFGIFIIWFIGYGMGRNSIIKEQRRAQTATMVQEIKDAKDDKPEPAPADSPERQPQASLTPFAAPKPLAFKPLDSVSTLLYFGAFLMITSVGLFVGLSEFSGIVKTIAVLVLALTFYGAGLFIYQKSKRLRPAAIAFTAIGLISLPLTGVAAYAYVANPQDGPLVWLITSVVCFSLYVVALWNIRQSLMGYLSVFMGLSLWLSIVAVIDAPLYFFGWAMVVLAALYLLAIKYLRLWHEVEEPLATSATVMVPATLTVMVLFGSPTISLVDQGITLLLGAVFYAIATWTERRSAEKTVFFILGYALLPAGVAYIAHGLERDWVTTSFTLAIGSIMQIAALSVYKSRMNGQWLRGGLTVGAIGLVAAAVLCAGTLDWPMISILLLIELLACVFVALFLRDITYAFLALVAVLVLPALVGFLALEPAAPRAAIVAAYFVIGGLLMVGGHAARRSYLSYIDLMVATYWASWGVAWFTGFFGSGSLPAVASAVMALAATVSTYYERRPSSIFVTTTMGSIAVLQFLHWQQMLTGTNVALWSGLIGAAYYAAAAGHKLQDTIKRYYDYWVLSGVVTLYLSSIFSLLTTGTTWPGVLFLALAGALTAYEAYKRHDKTGMYTGGGVILAAFELGLYHIGLNEWQAYWYLWAAYALAIAYREAKPLGIVVGAGIVAIGAVVGLIDHNALTNLNLTLTLLVLSGCMYAFGKVHGALSSAMRPLGDAWSYSGLAGLYAAAFIPVFGIRNTGDTMVNAVALMAAGALTSYEAYRQHSRSGLYLGGAIALIGLQWLLYQQDVREVQLYTHMWAAYFALLAWLSHRDSRHEEKQAFTLIALMSQTVPLSWEALNGNAGYGLVLLLESTAIVLAGLLLKYSLVRNWGLAVAVGSVLYQLREFEFFVLALLGASVIGLGVFLLLKNDRNKKA